MPGGVEESAQSVVFPGGLLLGPDHSGVGAAAQLQVDPLEAEGLHN